MIIHFCLRTSEVKPTLGWQALTFSELLRPELLLLFDYTFVEKRVEDDRVCPRTRRQLKAGEV